MKTHLEGNSIVVIRFTATRLTACGIVSTRTVDVEEFADVFLKDASRCCQRCTRVVDVDQARELTRYSGRPKTSEESPLKIAEVAVAEGYGAIGVTLCPGKVTNPGDDGMTGPWNRDLETDLDAIAAWGAAAVLTLIEVTEMERLHVPYLNEAVLARGMAWYHLPIIDRTAPDAEVEHLWQFVGANVRQHLRAGDRVLIHCRGGIGRAGTMAARLLVELGVATPQDALQRVRAVRPHAVETLHQEAHVLASEPLTPGTT